jgi:hypothetical protein
MVTYARVILDVVIASNPALRRRLVFVASLLAKTILHNLIML